MLFLGEPRLSSTSGSIHSLDKIVEHRKKPRHFGFVSENKNSRLDDRAGEGNWGNKNLSVFSLKELAEWMFFTWQTTQKRVSGCSRGPAVPSCFYGAPLPMEPLAICWPLLISFPLVSMLRPRRPASCPQLYSTLSPSFKCHGLREDSSNHRKVRCQGRCLSVSFVTPRQNSS